MESAWFQISRFQCQILIKKWNNNFPSNNVYWCFFPLNSQPPIPIAQWQLHVMMLLLLLRSFARNKTFFLLFFRKNFHFWFPWWYELMFTVHYSQRFESVWHWFYYYSNEYYAKTLIRTFELNGKIGNRQHPDFGSSEYFIWNWISCICVEWITKWPISSYEFSMFHRKNNLIELNQMLCFGGQT